MRPPGTESDLDEDQGSRHLEPAHATDSELTNDDVIIRYEGGEVVGLTVLHASTR